jgi:hypothetical protein
MLFKVVAPLCKFQPFAVATALLAQRFPLFVSM